MTTTASSRPTVQLTIIGATGGVGQHVVEQALEAGHRVTALVRDRKRLAYTHDHLTIVEGDATDPVALRRALRGADAVVCALGAPAWSRSPIRAEGTRCLIDAMHAEGTDRLVCVSVLGAADSRATLPWALRWFVFPLYLRWVVADHEAQESIVRGSGLRWTLVRPPFLTDGPLTRDYADGLRGDEPGLTLKISRADVADLMLRLITEGQAIGQARGISYRKAPVHSPHAPSHRPSSSVSSSARARKRIKHSNGSTPMSLGRSEP